MTELIEESGSQAELPPQPAYSIGKTLAAERARQEMSVADVARQLRLGVKQIEALEADDFVDLPGRTFVRGFVRNYARLLEIDPEPLLQALQQAAPAEEHAVSAPPRGGEFSPYPSRRWVWYAAAAAVMVLAAPLLVYLFLSREEASSPAAKTARPLAQAVPGQPVLPSQPAHTAPAPARPDEPVVAPKQAGETALPLTLPEPNPVTAPAPAAPAPVLPAAQPAEAMPVGGGRIVLKFDQDAWVEVRDKDGKKLLSQLNTAGSERTVDGVPPFTLVVGNAASVHIAYNGAAVDLTPYINVNVARLTLK